MTLVLEHYGPLVVAGLFAAWLVPQLRLQASATGLLLLAAVGALVVLSAPTVAPRPSAVTTAGANWSVAPASSAIGFSGITAAPLGRMRATKRFGAPASYQVGGRHTGVDLSDRDGASLYAVCDGVIAHVGPLYLDGPRVGRGPYAVVLDCGGQIYAIYSHNRRAVVQRGERVRAGQVIGLQGNEGYSFGSHLHLEIHVGAPFTGNWRQPFAGGRFIDPMQFF